MDTHQNLKELKKLEKAKQREEKKELYGKLKTTKDKNSSSKMLVENEKEYDCFPVDLDEMFDISTE